MFGPQTPLMLNVKISETDVLTFAKCKDVDVRAAICVCKCGACK
ncbi:MAG: hypothetical protein SPI74_00455 [Eubacterium sp.]|nr:hypothetical protein [Eubacterium sp.]